MKKLKLAILLSVSAFPSLANAACTINAYLLYGRGTLTYLSPSQGAAFKDAIKSTAYTLSDDPQIMVEFYKSREVIERPENGPNRRFEVDTYERLSLPNHPGEDVLVSRVFQNNDTEPSAGWDQSETPALLKNLLRTLPECENNGFQT
jgi:hypothetical protein